MATTSIVRAVLGASLAAALSGAGCDNGGELTPDELAQLKKLQLTADLLLPDGSNAFADDDGAARLGKRFFFEPLFGGPLGPDNDSATAGSLGRPGEIGKIA